MACALTGLLAGCATAMQTEPRLPVPVFPSSASRATRTGEAVLHDDKYQRRDVSREVADALSSRR